MVENEVQQAPPPKRDDAPPVEEGLPPWMATFADMVTLLLCFFVLLLSFASQDLANFNKLKGSIKEAFGVQMQDKSAKKTPYSSKKFESSNKAARTKLIMGMAMQIRALVEESDMDKAASVTMDQSGVTVRINDRAIFDPGSTLLKPEAATVLSEVIQTMEKNPDFNLVVKGHTNDTPPEGTLHDSNWVLSSARAAACLRYIIDHSDIKPDRMKAVGYAASKPLVPNTTPENRIINSRVEFFFTPKGGENW